MQYLLFTLVSLVVFGVGFFSTSALPNLSWTLVGLTSVSAAGYVGKKLARDQAPVLTMVAPDWASPGEWVTVRGRNLKTENPEGDDVVPELVKFRGRVTKEFKESFSASRIEARVPENLQLSSSVDVKVLRSDGIETNGIDFEVAGGPSVTSVTSTRIVLHPQEKNPIRRRNTSERELVISGQGFDKIEGTDHKAAAVLLDGRSKTPVTPPSPSPSTPTPTCSRAWAARPPTR